MLRAYKYRIYPTDEQKIMLAKTFGCCRFVYNWCLERKDKIWNEEKRHIQKPEMAKLVNRELKYGEAPWLAEVSASAIDHTIIDLFDAYKKFFHGVSNHPKKHKKNSRRQHFRDKPQTGAFNCRADFKNKTITIPKIPDIPCVFHRRFIGKVKQVCVEQLPSGKYRVSFLVDDGEPMPVKKPILPDQTVGIDTGLDNLAVLSDGRIFKNPREAAKEARKLKLINRRMARKQKGSKKYRILKIRRARLFEKVANRRHDNLHKITHNLACESQATTYCVEDLKLQEWFFKKQLALDASDAAIGIFYSQLKYKCDWHSKNIITISQWAPSSKMCSHCGYIYKQLRVQQRKWICPECGTYHERDLNAAVNIKHFGLSDKSPYPRYWGKVTSVEQPRVNDRSSEPKKQCCDSKRKFVYETEKVKGDITQMPDLNKTSEVIH